MEVVGDSGGVEEDATVGAHVEVLELALFRFIPTCATENTSKRNHFLPWESLC